MHRTPSFGAAGAAPTPETAPTAHPVAASTPPLPKLTYFATITVRVATPIEVGHTSDGVRRIIPIVGGTLEGPSVSGEVLNAGADFQLIKSATATELVAKYAIRMSDGEHLYISNVGMRVASAEDTAAIAAGQPVPPERVYFRCVPTIVGTGRWQWLEERLFIGSGRRRPDSVEIDVFEVK